MKNIINVINFIRGIEPRPGRNIDLVKPVREQIRIMNELHIRGTFLVQYDALMNEEIVELLKGLPEDFEIGLWLEVVQPQVENIGLKWRGRYPWDWHNDVGFLISYTPDERKRLIDEHMRKFKNIFGYAPKVVGSWHIDAVSMRYLSENYNITACCICRDQIGTDGYTLQGGYYNQAYYPSINNMFTPAQNTENQINMPVFRMLGSSAAFAYDFQLFDYDGVHSTIPTLEPAQLAKNDEWSNFLLDEIFDGNGLAFQYTQIGQENSFGWDNMESGINFQFRKAAQMQKNGKAEILTLGETGKFFKKTFSSTPPTTYVADKKWKNNDVKSFWYDSKYYRVNLFLENGILRIRDIYVFNENYAEKYLDKPCKTPSCEYRNLPVFDGVLYSDKEKNLKGGCYFCIESKPIVWKTVLYSENGINAKLLLTCDYGYASIMLKEYEISVDTDITNLTVVPVYDRDRVYGKNGNGDETFANHNGKASLTFIENTMISGNTINFFFDKFTYRVTLTKGFITPDFKIFAQDGKITLSLSQQKV